MISLDLWRPVDIRHEVRGGHEVDSMERSLDPKFRRYGGYGMLWDAMAMVDLKGCSNSM